MPDSSVRRGNRREEQELDPEGNRKKRKVHASEKVCLSLHLFSADGIYRDAAALAGLPRCRQESLMGIKKKNLPAFHHFLCDQNIFPKGKYPS